MKIKICGITRFEDARDAVEAGADLLGFNFYAKSPRYISPISAGRLIADIRCACSRVQIVGVFVNSSLEEINTITGQCALDLAQLCGDEPPETLEALNGVAFKALRPKDKQDLAQSIRTYPPRADSPAYLIDAYRPGAYGGTGQTADWSMARSLADAYPLLLAGGLTSDNVAEAIHQVRPWGVDVASGVEASPGLKDPARLAAFIKTARESGIE